MRKGNFTIDLLDLVEPYAYYFSSGEEFFRFYVAPGMNLTVSLDQNDFIASISFKGKGSDINNYIANKTRVFGDRMDYEVYKKEVDDFKSWADNDLKEKQKFLKKLRRRILMIHTGQKRKVRFYIHGQIIIPHILQCINITVKLKSLKCLKAFTTIRRNSILMR